MAHVDDLTFINAAQLLGSDELYIGRPSDTVDPDKRTDLDELITKLIPELLGADAAGISPFYETGTFTPIIYATSANPSSITYTTQRGSWVRIGNFVHVELALGTSARSGGSGNIRIGYIPFTSEEALIAGSVLTSGLPLPGVRWGLYGFSGGTSDGLRVYRVTDGGSINEMTIGQWPTSSNASLQAAFSYIMATP